MRMCLVISGKCAWSASVCELVDGGRLCGQMCHVNPPSKGRSRWRKDRGGRLITCGQEMATMGEMGDEMDLGYIHNEGGMVKLGTEMYEDGDGDGDEPCRPPQAAR